MRISARCESGVIGEAARPARRRSPGPAVVDWLMLRLPGRATRSPARGNGRTPRTRSRRTLCKLAPRARRSQGRASSARRGRGRLTAGSRCLSPGES